MFKLFSEAFNNNISRLVRPDIRIFHKPLPAFRVCGCAGVAAAISLAMWLVTDQRLSPWVMAGIAASAMATFLALTMLTKIITGHENIIYYHHEIAVVIVAAALLKLFHLPVLPYLDVTILGVGIFLVFGRVGCLMVGCCHGRPHHLGVCYRPEHADAGFTPYLVGVRLFPIQALESLSVFLIVLVGIALVLSGDAPGGAFAWYVGAYAIARFCLEMMRGDPYRPYLLGFSEAQWTSLILLCAVVGAEARGVMAFHRWHSAAAACVAAAMIAIALARHFRRAARHKLAHPRHVKEIAEALEALSNLASEGGTGSARNNILSGVQVARTSLGIQISMGRIMNGEGFTYHYALSSKGKVLNEEDALTLAGMIMLLKHPYASREFVKGDNGVFHMLINPARQDDGAESQTSTQSTEASKYAI